MGKMFRFRSVRSMHPVGVDVFSPSQCTVVALAENAGTKKIGIVSPASMLPFILGSLLS